MSYPDLVKNELERARAKNAPMLNAHEAYAVIFEEVDEFWDEVRKRRSKHDKARMLAELVQISAMCQRAAEDLKMLPEESI